MTPGVTELTADRQPPRYVRPATPLAVAKAATLLENVRRTPMVRGGRENERRRILRGNIETTLEERSVLPRLAKRIALQLIFKFEERQLGDRATWCALGDQLRREAKYLMANVGLVDRQIIVALPKLSAAHIEGLLEELTAESPTIARTVLNVALDAADPRAAAKRYMAEYCRVAEQLEAIDPSIARTLANATFMARVPSEKATLHFKHFADLFMKFRDDVGFARTVARAACRSRDPITAAKTFIATYETIVADLTSVGIEPDIARTLAGVASLGSNPMSAARKLLENFESVVILVKRTHPWVARTIALSACRGAEPLTMARSYMKNYDTIVQMVSGIDPHRAREVAAQAFRSDNPLRWAKRYLNELQRAV